MAGQAGQSNEAGWRWATAKERSTWVQGRCCKWQAGGRRGCWQQTMTMTEGFRRVLAANHDHDREL